MINKQAGWVLLTGEATRRFRAIPDNSIDLIVTSPPYDNLRSYNGYTFNFPGIAHECYRVLKPGGTLVWIVADATQKGTESLTSMEQALYFKKRVGFLMHDTMIWQRSSVPLSKRRYEQHWEYMFVLTKGVPKTFNGIRVPKLYPEKKPRKRKWFGRNGDNTVDYGFVGLTIPDKLEGNVWKIACQRASTDSYASKHPAIFPEELAQRHIHSWSNEGDVVLDPMCGSGTVGKMALTMGRKFIGIDISPEYIEIAKKRLTLGRGARLAQALGNEQQSSAVTG